MPEAFQYLKKLWIVLLLALTDIKRKEATSKNISTIRALSI
jgi:hypothetical protein